MNLTPEAFLSFYPQFAAFPPAPVLSEYLRQANARFSDFGEDTAEARRLFVAHKLTLYAASALPEGAEPSAELLTEYGRGFTSQVTSERVGEVSVTYAAPSAAASRVSAFRDLTETAFGLQLISLLRLYGFAQYIP